MRPIRRIVLPDKSAFIRAYDNAGNWANGASAIPAWEHDWADHYEESKLHPNAVQVELYLAPEFGPGCTIGAELNEDGTIKYSYIEAGVKATHERPDNVLFYQHPEMRLEELAAD